MFSIRSEIPELLVNVIEPLTNSCSVKIDKIDKHVSDLPEPDSPTKEKISPLSMEKETFFTKTLSLDEIYKPSMCSIKRPYCLYCFVGENF